MDVSRYCGFGCEEPCGCAGEGFAGAVVDGEVDGVAVDGADFLVAVFFFAGVGGLQG